MKETKIVSMQGRELAIKGEKQAINQVLLQVGDLGSIFPKKELKKLVEFIKELCSVPKQN